MNAASTKNARCVQTTGPNLAPDRQLVIGRYWCEPCGKLATVVRDALTVDIECPHCGQLALAASGDER